MNMLLLIIIEVEQNSAMLNRIVDSSSANIQIDLKKYEIEKEKVIDEMKKQQAALDSKMEEETIGNVKMELMSEEKKLSDMISLLFWPSGLITILCRN